MDLTWWQLLIGLLVLVVAVRLTANVDVAAILENRKRHRAESLKVLCPHATMETDSDGQIMLRVLVESPPGTIQAQCIQCGLVFSSYHSAVEAIGRMWGSNPMALVKAQKKFLKRAGRHYRV